MTEEEKTIFEHALKQAYDSGILDGIKILMEHMKMTTDAVIKKLQEEDL